MSREWHKIEDKTYTIHFDSLFTTKIILTTTQNRARDRAPANDNLTEEEKTELGVRFPPSFFSLPAILTHVILLTLLPQDMSPDYRYLL